ncbi:MAG: S8 family peptidase [Verrucomicrobia bacterium]|nr:S8 family peptidase [Verrucomicrobiota bacterium]MCH8514590.1 S8 family peptidase [Kiritimatiellia bacterium]
MSQINFILGSGERLTEPVKVKTGFGAKQLPYSLNEARERLESQFSEVVAQVDRLPADACPLGYAVMRWTLHPQYIAKSYFPMHLLQAMGLESVGSRTVEIQPRKWTRKEEVRPTPTTELYVAGKRSHFRQVPERMRVLEEGSKEADNLISLESVKTLEASTRRRLVSTNRELFLEVGLHLLQSENPDEVKQHFIIYATKLGFVPSTDLSFTSGLLWFLPMENCDGKLDDLAQFTLIRVIRPVPPMRGLRPFVRAAEVTIPCTLSELPPLSTEPKVAILDGGLPVLHAASDWVRRYHKLDARAPDDPDGLAHGLAVTSAFLFGPLTRKKKAPQPYAPVDHYRVLDGHSGGEDPYELYRTLGMVEEVLLSGQYQFLNLSLGPDLPIEDDEVQPWTAVIDEQLSDGQTLMTVAVGNNGERDRATRNDRIQVPADAVNALSVGSADDTCEDWSRASYSATGPGRCPGVVKPDLMAFGGGPEHYFHVLQEGTKPSMYPTQGTSFAAPYLLRTAVGIRALLGNDISPLAIKALLVHMADRKEYGVLEVGMGKIPEDLMEIVSCPPGVVRVLYQGELNPGKYIRAKIPLPDNGLTGMAEMKATFCFACPTDAQDAAAYTRAGLDIYFRPHADKLKPKKEHQETKSFFSRTAHAIEAELRNDFGKWETMLQGESKMRGSSLHKPVFDIHYNAREMGAASGSAAKIPYALVITLRAQKHTELYNEILQAYPQILVPIQPKVAVQIQT